MKLTHSSSLLARVILVQHTTLQVSVSLTPLGVKHHEEVAAVVYQHIRLLGELTSEQVQSYWEELSVCDWLNFHHKQVG